MGSLVTTEADASAQRPGALPPFRRMRSRATVASTWAGAIDLDQLDTAIAWPPDAFALVDRVLDASEAYRFLVSPPRGTSLPDIAAIEADAASWLARLDAGDRQPPDGVVERWALALAGAGVTIEELARGEPWDLIEALLGLHAVIDEMCAGLGAALAARAGVGWSFRADARELLATTGSLARLPTDVLRVLPRCRSGVAGVSIKSLSRHVWVAGPQVDVSWHRMLARPSGVTVPDQHANIVVLPWPMRVRAKDFRPIRYPLPNMDIAEFGFFQFDPVETIDIAEVHSVLCAAEDEAGTVDAVMLPESALTPPDIEPLERVLGEHHVWCVVGGVREPVDETTHQLGANWVHVGVRQGDVWRHVRQDKHHRWSLDGRQVAQYHLGGALSPTKRWWEAITIPRRSLQVIDQGVLTFVPLVCEDLARLEPVADVVRSIGPSLVITLLLDGPQLASRWTARYASVLADDPGSAVCTLTSSGMARRCRPPGCAPSNVIALWKDASGSLIEVHLEDDADAVLLATDVSFGSTVTADGRHHPGTSTVTLAAVQSIRSDRTERARCRRTLSAGRFQPPRLREHELSQSTSWAETFAEVAVSDPSAIGQVLARAADDERRRALGMPALSPLVHRGIDAVGRALQEQTLRGLVTAADRLRCSTNGIERATGTLLSIALEQRVFGEVMCGRLGRDTFDALGDGRSSQDDDRPGETILGGKGEVP